MSKYTEEQLAGFTKPPSNTEETRLANAVKQIREAISCDPVLKSKTIEVFGQGSYENDTNVKQNSDVDVNVMFTDCFYYEIPPNEDESKYVSGGACEYSFTEFKRDVMNALVNKFGATAVSRENKCINISENTNRVSSDVVPTWLYKRFVNTRQVELGSKLISDTSDPVINFPKQHVENNKRKNNATQKRYKRLTRIVKRIRYNMIDDGVWTNEAISSFLLESLMWNVPDNVYNNYSSWSERLKQAIIFLYHNTLNPSLCREWGEVSELLYLFHPSRKWSVELVNQFLAKMWQYLGF